MPPLTLAVVLATHVDKLRKTVILFYQLEPHIEEAYQNLHRVFDSLRGSSQIWHVDCRGDIKTTYDWKMNAGADAIVKRKPINPSCAPPPYFQSNISIPTLPAGERRLHFLPDRLLVWDGRSVGAVGFEQMEVSFIDQRFIEGGVVPRDAQIVGSTWKYANKKGGPDRRFNDNREIPIALYEEILLTSTSGLQEIGRAHV